MYDRNGYRLTLTTHDGEVIGTFRLGGEKGYPLPLRNLGPDNLAMELNDAIDSFEREKRQGEEFPV